MVKIGRSVQYDHQIDLIINNGQSVIASETEDFLTAYKTGIVIFYVNISNAFYITCIFFLLFGVINVVDYFYVCIRVKRSCYTFSCYLV